MEQKTEQIKESGKPEQKKEETLVRILSTDIRGNKNVYGGLTKIKGISFTMSKAICHLLGLDKRKRVVDLEEKEIQKITESVKGLKVPSFLVNRRKDFDGGEDQHLITNDLDLRKEFDIKRLRKIRSYKGVRHNWGLPVRGQRTRSHFRKTGRHKAVGVKKKK